MEKQMDSLLPYTFLQELNIHFFLQIRIFSQKLF